MPVVSLRGTSARQTGTLPLYGPLSNVYDAGTDTWCSSSGNLGPKPLWIGGHGFSSYLTASAAINSITVSARGYSAATARWASWTAQIESGGVAVGTAQTVAMPGSAGIMTFTLSGVTAAELIDPTMELKMTANRGYSVLTGNYYIDYADLIIGYTPGTPPPGLHGYWGAIPIL